MRVCVARLVLLGARNFDLLEAPLRQVDVASPQIASQHLMLESEPCSERTEMAPVAGSGVVDNLDFPVILVVTDGQITVAGYLLIGLSHGGRNLMRMEVATSLGVDQADGVAVSNESGIGFGIIICIASVGIEEPVIVGILVMITSNLLLG